MVMHSLSSEKLCAPFLSSFFFNIKIMIWEGGVGVGGGIPVTVGLVISRTVK